MLLRIENVSVHYASVPAVGGVNIEVPEGKIVAIIGANGAGKTTVLRSVSGLNKISSGAVWLCGRRIDGLPPEEIVALGVAHVPEGRRVFPDMSAEENLRLGAFLRKNKEEAESDLKRIFARFPRLLDRRKQLAKTMSGGEQQMLAIGRALMSAPRLLLLDEPSMGLSPAMGDEIIRVVLEIKERGVSVVLVEQNAEIALHLADYGYVMETGAIVLEGGASGLRNNVHVQKSYLGC